MENHNQLVELYFHWESWQRAKSPRVESITVANVMIQWLSSTSAPCLHSQITGRQTGGLTVRKTSRALLSGKQGCELTMTYPAWRRSGWCPAGCHSPPLSSSLWPGSSGCSPCHSPRHALLWVHTNMPVSSVFTMKMYPESWSLWQPATYLDNSSNLDLANSRLLRSTCSWGVWANNSCKVMI